MEDKVTKEEIFEELTKLKISKDKYIKVNIYITNTIFIHNKTFLIIYKDFRYLILEVITATTDINI